MVLRARSLRREAEFGAGGNPGQATGACRPHRDAPDVDPPWLICPDPCRTVLDGQHGSTLVQNGSTRRHRASRPRDAREDRQRSANTSGRSKGCCLCLWIFACPDGGRRPPPGGLPSGVEPGVVIRGIREIRGYDQSVSSSPSSRPFSSAGSTALAQPPLRTHDGLAVCPHVIVPLERRASVVCTRSSTEHGSEPARATRRPKSATAVQGSNLKR
jgi:hypothetical protein